MNNYTILIILSYFISIQVHAQKSIYEAYTDSKVDWHEMEKQLDVSNCATGDLSVITFNQSDPIWKNEEMVPGKTIGAIGCAMTSMAMLLHAHGQDITPKLLNDYLIANSGYTSSGEIKWNIAVQFGNSSVTYTGPEHFSYEKIRLLLHSGNPVIMWVSNRGDHFIIITGYENEGNESKDFYINDPAGGKRRRLSAYSADCSTSKQNLRIFSGVNAPCIITTPPAHCFNCSWDPHLGELDTDCGGSCPPCNTTGFSLNIGSQSEVMDEIIATGTVLLESAKGNDIVLSNNHIIKAGTEIILGNNTLLEGSGIDLKITSHINELTRNCDDICIYVPNLYYIGHDNMMKINVTGVEYIHCFLFPNHSHNPIEEYAATVSHDGAVWLFDVPSITGGYMLHFTEIVLCTGEVLSFVRPIVVLNYSPKLLQIDENIPEAELITESISDKVFNKLDYKIFPNPATMVVNVEFYNLNDRMATIEIRQVSGNLVEMIKEVRDNQLSIDLSRLPKGLYIFTVKTDIEIKNKKLIVQ